MDMDDIYTEAEVSQPKSYARVLADAVVGNPSMPSAIGSSKNLATNSSPFEIITEDRHKLNVDLVEGDQDWSEVSSLTSCDWPPSILSESVATDSVSQRAETPILTTPSAVDTHGSRNDGEDLYEPPEDTRIVHARAGSTKHAKRAKRRHLVRNLPAMYRIESELYYEPLMERKPWKVKHFPAGFVPPKFDQHLYYKGQAQIKQARDEEVRMKEIIPKPISKRRTG